MSDSERALRLRLYPAPFRARRPSVSYPEVSTPMPYNRHHGADDDARAAAAHAPMSDREFRGHLAKAVRGGSVGAMRLWWRTRSEDELDAERELDPFAELDAPFTDSPARRRSGVLDELDDPLTKGEQNAD
jgi:hypothetical protein